MKRNWKSVTSRKNGRRRTNRSRRNCGRRKIPQRTPLTKSLRRESHRLPRKTLPTIRHQNAVRKSLLKTTELLLPPGRSAA